jgi:hypothetical protein
MMSELIAQEQEHVAALLALTRRQFKQTPNDDKAAQLQAVCGWQFNTSEGDVEAEVYVFDSAELRQAAIEHLLRHNPIDPVTGLPGISSNGPLVFIVRYTGQVANKTAMFEALGVASALAGEEE